MDRSEIIDALGEMDEVPFSRSTLEKLEDNELAQVANEVGASDLRLALSAKVGGLRRGLERDGLVVNNPEHVELGFAVQSTLGCGPGDTSRFTENRAKNRDARDGGISFEPQSTLGCGPGDVSRFTEDRHQDNATNEDGGSEKGISFTPRSTLGCGPGDTSRFNR